MVIKKSKGRPSLISKENIIKCALDLGLPNASMHAIGKKLGVSATALYRHVSSKEELIIICCDYIVEKIELSTQENWEAYLYCFGKNFRKVLLSNPNSVEFVRSNQSFTPANNRLFNHALEVLTLTQFNTAVGFMAVTTVYRKVIDLVQYQEQYQSDIQGVSPSNIEEFPHLVELFKEVKPINFDDYFEDSLKITIEGIKSVYC